MNNSLEQLQQIRHDHDPCRFCGHPRHLHRNHYGRCLCKAFTGPTYYSSASWNPDCLCKKFISQDDISTLIGYRAGSKEYEEFPLMSLDPLTNKITILIPKLNLHPDQERLTIL